MPSRRLSPEDRAARERATRERREQRAAERQRQQAEREERAAAKQRVTDARRREFAALVRNNPDKSANALDKLGKQDHMWGSRKQRLAMIADIRHRGEQRQGGVQNVPQKYRRAFLLPGGVPTRVVRGGRGDTPEIVTVVPVDDPTMGRIAGYLVGS